MFTKQTYAAFLVDGCLDVVAVVVEAVVVVAVFLCSCIPIQGIEICSTTSSLQLLLQ